RTRSDHSKWYTGFHPIDRRRELHHGTPMAQDFLGHRMAVAAKVRDDRITPLLFFPITLSQESFKPLRSFLARLRCTLSWVHPSCGGVAGADEQDGDPLAVTIAIFWHKHSHVRTVAPQAAT